MRVKLQPLTKWRATRPDTSRHRADRCHWSSSRARLRLSAQHYVNAGQDKFQLARRQSSHAFGEQRLIKGHNLRDVRHRVLGQARVCTREQHVSGSICPVQIAGQRNTDDCGQVASIQGVTLHDDNRSSKTRARPRRRWKTGPPDIPARNHHSACSKTRLLAAATKASFPSLIRSHTLSIASVISSGAWRATYSLSAALYTSLRDLRVRRASRSTSLKISSGTETAVFIPRV